MPMAVERNFGNLAEMYAMVIAVADLGIRPARVDNLMVSDVGASGEGWPCGHGWTLFLLIERALQRF